MKKTKEKKATGSSLLPKLVLVAILVLGIWSLSGDKLRMNSESKIKEEVAQLSPTSNLGMGSARRTYDKTTYTLDATVFLGKPAAGKSYFAWLRKGDEKVFLGEMTQAGDVFSLNYTSPTNYFDFKEVVVTLQSPADAEAGKLEGEVLVGTFEAK